MGAYSLKPKPSLSTQEEDPPHSSSPLPKPTTTLSIIFVLLTTFLALSISTASASQPHSHPYQTSEEPNAEFASPLTKLNHPVVIMVSCDGFRFGYQFKTPTPNIHLLIKSGTEAETGLIPVFPSATFPNHYSIATGLYPASHGIINNNFFDPNTNKTFTRDNREPEWWLGEPLWETVVNHGFNAATYMWPGSEVPKGKWTCPTNFCQHYNQSVPFEERVDTILGYFDLPPGEIPVFMNLYMDEPDTHGHQVGPDDLEITKAVGRIDTMIGRLIKGLEKREIFEHVHIILVGDHGMVATCDEKVIYLDDFAQWINISANWVESHRALLAIRPTSGHSPLDVLAKMNEGLESGKVQNGTHLKLYLKEQLPSRLHYIGSDRIPPIIGLVDEGYNVLQSRGGSNCGGSHGYDNSYFSMRSIFIGHGPRFLKGKKVRSFKNVQIYNLVTSILNIEGAPNNGTKGFPKSVLKPKPRISNKLAHSVFQLKDRQK